MHKNFLKSVDTRPTLDLKKNTKSEISLRYSKGSKLSSVSLSLQVKFLGQFIISVVAVRWVFSRSARCFVVYSDHRLLPYSSLGRT